MSYSYNRPFEGNHNAYVARGENEFETPALGRPARKASSR